MGVPEAQLVRPDGELFEEGVFLIVKWNDKICSNLYGLLRLKDGKTILPCLYKSILGFKNGFARAINMAGSLIYVSEEGESLYDRELPFIPELCADFDKSGRANIACLIDSYQIINGYMTRDGEMFLSGYNEV